MIKTISINGTEYKVKYTIRALFMFEQITGKAFAISTLLDNYLFFYCMILANNPDNVLEWDNFLSALDENPELFKSLNDVVEQHQKDEDIFTHEDDDASTDNEGKKKD
jgi:hypothetical protein